MTNMQNNTDENFNEDFERLLKQFVSEKYKDVKLDDMQTEDDEKAHPIYLGESFLIL